MRIVNIEVYKYEELSQSAKSRALHNWHENGFYHGDDENRATLQAFANIFPITINDWEYGYRNYINFDFTASEEIEELSGVRLSTYIINNYFNDLFKGKYYSMFSKKEKSPNNPSVGKLKRRRSKAIFTNDCVLTGYCLDYVILNPVYEFLKNPSQNTTFRNLMQECLSAWVKACGEDHEYFYSEESFKEYCADNDCEFYSDGRKY